jgi:hypothetical protein
VAWVRGKLAKGVIPIGLSPFKGGVAMARLCPVLLPGVTVLLFVGLGCGDNKKTDSAKDGTKDADVVLLEYEEIDLIPGNEKEVKLKKGKAESVEPPKDTGVSAKVEDGKVIVKADKDAKEGTHNVKVKGPKGKEATLKVKVKKDKEGK